MSGQPERRWVIALGTHEEGKDVFVSHFKKVEKGSVTDEEKIKVTNHVQDGVIQEREYYDERNDIFIYDLPFWDEISSFQDFDRLGWLHDATRVIMKYTKPDDNCFLVGALYFGRAPESTANPQSLEVFYKMAGEDFSASTFLILTPDPKDVKRPKFEQCMEEWSEAIPALRNMLKVGAWKMEFSAENPASKIMDDMQKRAKSLFPPDEMNIVKKMKDLSKEYENIRETDPTEWEKQVFKRNNIKKTEAGKLIEHYVKPEKGDDWDKSDNSVGWSDGE